MTKVTVSLWAPGHGEFRMSYSYSLFSDLKNSRVTKFKVILKQIVKTPGDDAGNLVALGTRYIRVYFEHDTQVQRAQKPLSYKFKHILNEISENSRR